jgi:hypothetical protein
MVKIGQIWEIDLLGQYADQYAVYTKIIIEKQILPGYYQCVSATGTYLYFNTDYIERGKLLDD